MNEDDKSEAELQRLIDAPDPAGSNGTDPVRVLVAEMRTDYGSEPPPPVGAALSEFVDVHLFVEKGDPLATAASNATGPAEQVAELPKRRDTHDKRSSKVFTTLAAFVGTITGKLAVGATVALAATGGAHAAGVVDVPVLPDAPKSEVADDGPDAEVDGQTGDVGAPQTDVPNEQPVSDLQDSDDAEDTEDLNDADDTDHAEDLDDEADDTEDLDDAEDIDQAEELDGAEGGDDIEDLDDTEDLDDAEDTDQAEDTLDADDAGDTDDLDDAHEQIVAEEADQDDRGAASTEDDDDEDEDDD